MKIFRWHSLCCLTYQLRLIERIMVIDYQYMWLIETAREYSPPIRTPTITSYKQINKHIHNDVADRCNYVKNGAFGCFVFGRFFFRYTYQFCGHFENCH